MGWERYRHAEMKIHYIHTHFPCSILCTPPPALSASFPVCLFRFRSRVSKLRWQQLQQRLGDRPTRRQPTAQHAHCTHDEERVQSCRTAVERKEKGRKQTRVVAVSDGDTVQTVSEPAATVRFSGAAGSFNNPPQLADPPAGTLCTRHACCMYDCLSSCILLWFLTFPPPSSSASHQHLFSLQMLAPLRSARGVLCTLVLMMIAIAHVSYVLAADEKAQPSQNRHSRAGARRRQIVPTES